MAKRLLMVNNVDMLSTFNLLNGLSKYDSILFIASFLLFLVILKASKFFNVYKITRIQMSILSKRIPALPLGNSTTIYNYNYLRSKNVSPIRVHILILFTFYPHSFTGINVSISYISLAKHAGYELQVPSRFVKGEYAGLTGRQCMVNCSQSDDCISANYLEVGVLVQHLGDHLAQKVRLGEVLARDDHGILRGERRRKERERGGEVASSHGGAPP